MFLPGIISLAFYRRRPSPTAIVLGLVFTVVVSGLLGFWQDYGTSRVWLNTILASGLGVILYVGILAYLWYRYLPRREASGPAAPSQAVSPPR